MVLWQVLFVFPLLWLTIRCFPLEDNAAVVYDQAQVMNQTGYKPPERNTPEFPMTMIMTTLEMVQTEIGELQNFETEQLTNDFGKKSKTLTVFSSVFNALGGFLTLLSVFTETDDLEVISSMFKQVNKKLDKISQQIDNVENTVELQGLLSNYIPWHFSVINGIEKLSETFSHMAIEEDIRKRRIQAEDFIKFFEDNQIESHVNNLIQLTTKSDSVFHENIYQSLFNKANCKMNELNLIHEKVTGIVTSGSQLVLAYRSFKQLEKPKLTKYLNALFSFRKMFDAQTWYCKETAIDRSKKAVFQMINGTKKRFPLKRIGKMLSINYPWYSWSLGLTKQKSPHFRDNFYSGNQFYELKGLWSLETSLLITWQGVNETSRCNRMLKANTIIFLDMCKRCLKTHLYAPENMLTSIKCPKERNPDIKNYIDKSFPGGTEIPGRRIHWIASGFKQKMKPCRNACNNQGQCKVIPYTSQIQCFCYANYIGKNCETEIVEETNIEKMVLNLQRIYRDAFKIPLISSILIQGENLSKQMRYMMQRIDKQFELTHILVKYVNSLQKFDYLLELSFAYQKKEITLDVYNLRMKSFLSHNDIYFIFKQLTNALLANGFADKSGSDFFNTFKKIIALDRGACTNQYGKEATALLKRLSRMDIAAAEAILAHYHFQSFYLNAEHKKNMLSSAMQLAQGSTERMRNYARYWEKTSCPPLNVTHLTQTGCGTMLSFEGMKVKLFCDGGREAVPPVIECNLSKGKLEWNATAKCVPGWSTWGEWSSCSSTCGQGVQTRSRKCLGETNDEHCNGSSKDTRTCNKEDCCQEKYGKFKCPVGWCIDLSRVCDGTADCALDEDEAKTRCNYLRSGNRIALRNLATSSDWLSVLYTDYVVSPHLRYGRAYLNRCIKSERVAASEWKQCEGNSMLVYGSHNQGRDGQSIRYGDRIALYYRKTYSEYRWFRCYSDYCISYICSKAPGQFDFSDTGGCKSNEFIIQNYEHPNSTTPIRNGDIVIISADNGALKGNGYNRKITLKKCSFEELASSKCKDIAWQIFVQ